VIAPGLWYWDLDRGGAAARAHQPYAQPAFIFPEMLLYTPGRTCPLVLAAAWVSMSPRCRLPEGDAFGVCRGSDVWEAKHAE
jgi:hypothetical protein